MTSRELDRAALLRHDALMRRPVREIFPPAGPRVPSVCRFCKASYTRSPHVRKALGFCSSACREAFADAQTGRRHSARAPQFRVGGP
jgi:hypothetical protein